MTDAWDLRSNIKGKPGSQGTLFRAADRGLLNPQQRWPRGYTPERLNEVRGALKDTAIYADPETAGVEEEDWHARARVESLMKPRVEQALARSTVPAEHLRGISILHNEAAEGTNGTYWPETKMLAVEGLVGEEGRFGTQDSRSAERTLIHEVGHHVDNQTGTTNVRLQGLAEKHAQADLESRKAKGEQFVPDKPTETDKAMARNRVESGVAEAVADRYYVQHYRGPGRKGGTPDRGVYQENFTRPQLEQKYPGYHDVQPHVPGPLNEQQFATLPGLEHNGLQVPTTPEGRLRKHIDDASHGRDGLVPY